VAVHQITVMSIHEQQFCRSSIAGRRLTTASSPNAYRLGSCQANRREPPVADALSVARLIAREKKNWHER
jgi:hypothetical protein